MIPKQRNLSLLLLTLVAGSLLASCGSNRKQVHQCAIYGTVDEKDYNGKLVYLSDPYTREKLDSARVEDGEFEFPFPHKTDSLNARIVVLTANHTDNNDPMYTETLPVVLEKGTIRVKMGDILSTGGTPLNDVLKQLLISIQKKADLYYDRTDLDVKVMRSEMSDLFVDFVRQNKDNPIGLYVYWSYHHSIDALQWAKLPGELGGEFEQKANALREGLNRK